MAQSTASSFYVFLLLLLILSRSFSFTFRAWSSIAAWQSRRAALLLHFGLCCHHLGCRFNPCCHFLRVWALWEQESCTALHLLGPFLKWVFIFLELSCMSCLYIFEINSLSVASFATIFSHSEGCLFTLLIVSFVVQIF